MSYFTLHTPVKTLSLHFLSFPGEGEEVHASPGQLKTQRRGEGLHVQQIRLCSLQHRVKVCACGWRPVFVYVRESEKREFCSCHLLAEVLVIFYKGGHV